MPSPRSIPLRKQTSKPAIHRELLQFRKNDLGGNEKEHPNPQEVEGKLTLFVVNLPPKKMLREVSEGMLQDIGYSEGITPVLAIPECFVPNGARAG